MIVKYNHTKRFGRGDTQAGLEIYPKLWKKSYAYIDLGYSPRAIHYPRRTSLSSSSSASSRPRKCPWGSGI